MILFFSENTSVRVFPDFPVMIVGTDQFASQTTRTRVKMVEFAGKLKIFKFKSYY